MLFPLDVNNAHYHMKELENLNSKGILFYPAFNHNIIIFLSLMWTSHELMFHLTLIEKYHPTQVFPSTQRVIESFLIEKT